MDRKLDKPAYKPAISPGPPILPTTYQHRASRCLILLYAYTLTLLFLPSSTPVEDPLQIRPFRAKRTQFAKSEKSTQPQFSQRLTPIYPALRHQKQTQNEPKRTQSKPNFSLVRGSRSQNEPKQTQSKPNFKRDNLRGALHVCRYIFQAARGFFCPSPTFPYSPYAELPFLQP